MLAVEAGPEQREETPRMSPKPMPLHHQLREKLLNRILGGEWAPGEAMLTEFELAAEYRVSRQTIRQALRALQYEGVVESRRGSGTYVREPLPGGPVLLEWMKTFSANGHAAAMTTRVVRREMRVVGEAESALDVPIGTEVELTEKLRLRDGRPFCLTYSFRLPRQNGTCSSELGPKSAGTLSILATVLHPYEARLLSASAHTAALEIEVIERDAGEVPQAFHRSVVPNTNLRIDLGVDGAEIGRLSEILDLTGDSPAFPLADRTPRQPEA